MTKVLIIAEAGVNHNGDMLLAKRLIEVAAGAGADLVKFQSFSADRLVTQTAQKARYQTAATEGEDTQYTMLKQLELTPEMHLELIAHCKAFNIGFFSTGFDVKSIDLLIELGQDRFKIPSGEITNLPYLRHIGSQSKPVILSTGMANLGEVEAAIEALEQSGTAREKITVLHCTTEYPAPVEQINLRAIPTIRSALNVDVGYSDHTLGIEASIAAVALGATVIEKHFTLDRKLPGPDHGASLLPEELRALVAGIRNVEKALGDGVKRPMPSEIGNRIPGRKSIVAACHISVGDLFTNENLTTKRPGTGISPMRWDNIIGQKAQKDYAPDDII